MSEKTRSYRNTALLAISSVINIVLSIIRNKVFAVYLGPAGIGLFGMLNDFFNSVHSFGSLGMANSGVHAISQAKTKDDAEVRRVYNSFILFFTTLSFILTIAVFAGAAVISRILIGDESLSPLLRIACVVVLFRFRSAIYSVLITGLNRVGMLAKGVVLQGVITTLIGVGLVMSIGIKGVSFFVIAIGLTGWLVGYMQSRQLVKELPVHRSRLSWKEMTPILVLGISTLWSGLMGHTVNLTTKSWISHTFGKDYLGYYQVAIGFTLTYISFITTSITTDYYPRLVTTVSKGPELVNEFVNQQIGVSMALIMPLLFIMLTFSKLFVSLLFSSEFLAAAPLISYAVAGTFIRVVAWPIAYVFLAHRATKTYLLSETVGNGSMLLLNFLALQTGVFAFMGLAYVLHYVVYLVLITVLYYKRFNGQIMPAQMRLFVLNGVIITLIIIAKVLVSETITYVIGSALILFYFYRSRREYIYMIRSILKKR